MNLWMISIISCLTLGQAATESPLAKRFDTVVRAMMPEWVLQPVDPLYRPDPSEELFRWRKRLSESGPGLLVTVRTYDAPDLAERALEKIPLSLSTGAAETQGIGDHAYLARVAGTDWPWSGTVYARIDARLMMVSGDKDGADIRALAAALAAEVRKTKRWLRTPPKHWNNLQ